MKDRPVSSANSEKLRKTRHVNDSLTLSIVFFERN